MYCLLGSPIIIETAGFFERVLVNLKQICTFAPRKYSGFNHEKNSYGRRNKTKFY